MFSVNHLMGFGTSYPANVKLAVFNVPFLMNHKRCLNEICFVVFKGFMNI